MPREHLDRLRGFYEAFGEGDFDRALEALAPEVELRPAAIAIDQTTVYRGRDGLRKFMAQITEPWDSVTVEPTELLEAPGDRVLAIECWHARGRDGLQLDFELFDIYWFRDGLISRIDGYRDKPAALEAIGLVADD